MNFPNDPYLLTIQTLAQKRKVSVYLVGGLLRDKFLNRDSFDADFAVSKDAIKFAKAFSVAMKGAFVLLDEDHPCARVVKKDKGTLRTFDFTDFRAPSLPQDIALRDFTINTLCLNVKDLGQAVPWEDQVSDFQGGLKDLKRKTVRMVSANAFKDDPLRLMRAFSLFAQLGFKIEAKTFSQIKKQADLIGRVSIERVREEWFKVMSSTQAYPTLVLMQKAGLLEKVIPQLLVMRGVHQGGYHHLDVWHHSLEVVRQFELVMGEVKDPFIQKYLEEEIGGGHKRYALLKFACLLHDIGKPETKKKEKDRMTFHGHEHVGAGIIRHIAKQLKVSVKERHFLEDMATWHLRPGYLANFKRPSERMIFRFLRDTADEALSVLLLALADQRSTCGPLTTKARAQHHSKICWDVINRFIESKSKKPLERLLTGHDLIKRLRLAPSPLFGKILEEVAEAQALGKISSKQEALLLAKKIAQIK